MQPLTQIGNVFPPIINTYYIMHTYQFNYKVDHYKPY